jgi:hypothetical protein
MNTLQLRARQLRKEVLGLVGLGACSTADAAILVATGAGIHADASGIPDTDGFLGMSEADLKFTAFGDGVKLWGTSGPATKVDFFSHEGFYGPVYFGGMSLNWSGTLEGNFVGDQWIYDAEEDGDVFFPGDHLVLDYEFTVNQSSGIQFSYEFHLHAGMDGTATTAFWTANHATWIDKASGGNGSVEAPDQTTALVSGSVRFSPFTWSSEPVNFDQQWKLSLVVQPWGVSDWEAGDSIEVIVPGHSIDVGINVVPVPEPSAAILGIGLFALLAVACRRLRKGVTLH